MSFSLTKGTPIAQIIGGRYDGKYLHIVDEADSDTEDLDNEKMELIQTLIYGRDEDRHVLKASEIEKLEDAIKDEIPPKEPRLRKVYDQAMTIVHERVGKEFHLYDGQLVPVPLEEEDQVQRIYISGPSGSGKSTWIARYSLEYQDFFPDNPIFLFSRKEEDRVVDEVPNLKRIMIDEELLENPIEMEELKDSLVIFDDIDTIKDKDLLNGVRHLRDDILECGRSSNIYTISTSHMLMNWKVTRGNLAESSDVVVFPKSGAFHITRFLKEYLGFDKPAIKRVLKLPSRWVQIHRNMPQYILFETGAYIFN